jgi:hypothetical protein
LSNIQELIRDSFGLEAEIVESANVIFLRVKGLDNASLADWIRVHLSRVYVSVKRRRSYEFSDDGWIKIEKDVDNGTINKDSTKHTQR